MYSGTRGHGLLEGFLARRRCAMANALVPTRSREGSVLDIGCGTYPLFLTNTRFAHKAGIDRVTDPFTVDRLREHGIDLRHFDLAEPASLPFDCASFDVVTMLAVVEHITPNRLSFIISEVHRVLKPGGLLIATTPAWWTDRLLRMMARMRLVSPEEIEEHASAFRPGDLVSLVASGGFARDSIRNGTFELGMNLWITATKELA
ncbi:MAG: hypothetical protein AMXMBFR84_00250 [Candidatus Hydrogenedentota bacterium]